MTITNLEPIVAEAINPVIVPLTEIIDNNHGVFEGKEFEMLKDEENILFELYSTGAALGYITSNGYPYKSRIDKIVQNAEISTISHGVKKYITEEMLYDFMLEAGNEKCKRFRKWVTNVVLPQIRKTGGYIPHDEDMSDDEIMARALIVAQNTIAEKSKKLDLAEKENLKLTSIIESQKPKLEYLDEILSCDDALLVTTIAFDYGLSAVALNRILEEERIQRKVRGQWVLYSKYLGKGYTKTETKMIGDKPRVQTLWTQKGRMLIHDVLAKRNIRALMDVANEQIGMEM